jgi:hypothetical protein
MLSKKSFGGNKQNFLKLLTRFVHSDVRNHMVFQKNEPGPSYRHYRSQRRDQRGALRSLAAGGKTQVLGAPSQDSIATLS